ncbi:MAG: hypothetical protein ACLGHL_02670 [Actinomycetota bacterium]
MRTRTLVLLLASILVLAACGSDDADTPAGGSEGEAKVSPDDFSTPFGGAEVYPVLASSEITVGQNRFLIGLLDSNDAPTGSPEISVEVSFYDLEASEAEPVGTETAEFIYIVKEQKRGLYVAHPSFERAGEWGAEFSITGDGIDETLRTKFQVAEESTTPAVGDKVPASDTPTLDDAPIEELSTDDDPVKRFYETSIAEALKRGEPFVAVFATPKFCVSAVCGPTLDDVEAVAEDFPEITFIHTEIYQDNDPSNPPVEAVTEWGLPSEPWVFVVDGAGRLVAKFEGSAPAVELRPVLEGLK